MNKPAKRELYVEGGGDHNPSLASECRKAFHKLFERAGITQKPKVIACGGRKEAYKAFCRAHETGEAEAWLLVDAEEPAPSWEEASPWRHVETREGDHWERPPGATDEQLHFMHVCMETWLIVDRDALLEVFPNKLDESKLPSLSALEETKKKALFDALRAATKPTRAKEYGKGAHSFTLLAKVTPEALRRLKWGKRFLDAMATTGGLPPGESTGR